MNKAKRMFVVSSLQHGLMKVIAEEKKTTMSELVKKAMDQVLKEELFGDEEPEK